MRLKGDRGQNVILHFELLSSRMKGQTPPKGGGLRVVDENSLDFQNSSHSLRIM